MPRPCIIGTCDTRISLCPATTATGWQFHFGPQPWPRSAKPGPGLGLRLTANGSWELFCTCHRNHSEIFEINVSKKAERGEKQKPILSRGIPWNVSLYFSPAFFLCFGFCFCFIVSGSPNRFAFCVNSYDLLEASNYSVPPSLVTKQIDEGGGSGAGLALASSEESHQSGRTARVLAWLIIGAAFAF